LPTKENLNEFVNQPEPGGHWSSSHLNTLP